jgi:hypothetical protein
VVDHPPRGHFVEVAVEVALQPATDLPAIERTISLTLEQSHRGPGLDVATPIVVGPVVQRLQITFPASGEYEYQCDVHATEMRGTIVVAG